MATTRASLVRAALFRLFLVVRSSPPTMTSCTSGFQFGACTVTTVPTRTPQAACTVYATKGMRLTTSPKFWLATNAWSDGDNSSMTPL